MEASNNLNNCSGFILKECIFFNEEKLITKNVFFKRVYESMIFAKKIKKKQRFGESGKTTRRIF